MLNRRSQRGMVEWYRPRQLIKTGAEVIVSTLFARHADSRLGQSAKSPKPDADYRAEYEGTDFWIDYAADVGDGWNPTYAVASCLSSDLTPNGTFLPRGQVLVLGGDLVYPTPRLSEYHARLLNPYSAACGAGPKGDLFALPGNHDWYDSLVAFTRLFCYSTAFAGWDLPQTHAYFTIRLPNAWWLIGLDTQLVHDIDPRQFEYFRSLADEIPSYGKIILCTSEPFWLRVHPSDEGAGETLLTTLVEDLFGERVRLFLAGDIHHYRRHSHRDGQRHKITCGLGGAFLHPTHVAPQLPQDDLYSETAHYPNRTLSWWLTLRNLMFPILNKSFGIVTGIAYLLVAWANGVHVGEQFGSGPYAGQVSIDEIGRLGFSELDKAVLAALHSAILSPVGSLFYLITFLGFWFFTDRTSPVFRAVGGFLHASSHIIVGFFVYWAATFVSITVLGFEPKSIPQYLIAGGILFAGGWLAGSVLLGLYLTISLNLFGRHANEAFSSLKVQDYKGFIRIHIDRDGHLKAYVIGMDKVPRRWKQNDGSVGPLWKPADGGALQPKIVDSFCIQ